MKKIFITALWLIVPLAALGQGSDSFRSFYNKYSGRDGYTTVEMSGEMFKAINAVEERSGNGVSQIMENIDTMVIVVADNAGSEFEADVSRLVRGGEYTSVTVVRNGSDGVEFFVRNRNGKTIEFLMVVSGSGENVVMSITGNDLNINQISRLASGIR